ncbi:G2/M phase-specific E3 ubiquitin-protein ligase-like [Pimephales promelas]|uniref:G2/M phase-specific E3 ubiquitin-protein ligase-like n=2 Tax=Pimephales promelas TaxID=90988 RepID=UPI00195551D9|nr:G2/M phase-specific E3 ubiquitin-protein ligase-like [Pimephales promelas]
MAEDYGGPRREFFRILMSEVQSSLGIFEGKPGNVLFSYNQDALQQNKFYTAGKLTAWSILHNGPGIKCLNHHLFEMMCGRSQTIDLSTFELETLHDTDIQHRLEKILQCKTTAEMLEVKMELGDWIAECGIPNIYSASLADFPAIYQQIITHYMYHRVSSMIQQFIAGMNACGNMWQVVQRNWETFAPLFTHTSKKLSRNDVRGLFDIKWSLQGSNKRDQEEDTIFLWEWWLMSIENNELDVTLEDLLIFVTGADSVPPLGFPHNCEIQFYDQEPGSQRFPFSSTCALILYLPRGITEEAIFKDLMQMSIKGSVGFGKV